MLATLRSWFRGGITDTTKQWEEDIGDDGLEAVQASDDWMRANAGSFFGEERGRRAEEMKTRKRERLLDLRRAELEKRMAEREKEVLFSCWVKQDKARAKRSRRYVPIRVMATIPEE
ncbi:hypothetical protein LTS18_001278 [Coniosporium uncinatum]|uniref:Uncharacterized protein n=1 Tax=Coniosporium uncinatum TaxID=93489 RepID=A0ACC3DY94_9PEZI|nr:hypothetical protein LTS18_001278 [Coniosporium uncinatum]